ncbi:HAD-superfamily subfamily IB hydrolase, TIGR01490 [Glycomyces harbinensis]|uniref:HAD-superfamily subfamily IB hydrolase, TIGR01490 n=1 Tax=Glycomyces harbinensis TaxID=58114 RepID=A0A1G6V5M5_9ACTN|nr:HAD-superfamily subfamily IB hydrolase, TIGR01490 [Glycomyces harbinensis]
MRVGGSARAHSVVVDHRFDDDSAHVPSAAFFDVDNTLMHGAATYWLARALAKHGVLSAKHIFNFAWKQARFKFQGKELHGEISSVKTSALELVAGFPVDEMRALCEEVVDRDISPRILAPVRRLAERHMETDQEVWLVTASPVELAGVIASRLGLTGALGTIAEIEDGCYTGRLVGDLMHGPAKADGIAQLAAERGLDLEQCTAYSDSANDLPMLRKVGRAIAVNPDSRLARQARHHGWPVLDYRRGRRAAKLALPTAAAAGVGAGLLYLYKSRDRD